MSIYMAGNLCLKPLESNLFLNPTSMSIVIEGQTVEGTLRAEVGVNRLDAASSREFKKEIDSLWSDGVTAVEFDFSKVDFIDSSGVGALLGVYKRLPQGNASVRLTSVKAPVQSVIELLRLHRIFQIAS
ncbi:hypothetical protein VDG1235_4437 [Verrucomicrobiia bacterium DG1235]|nr:hypothetical protein VDG1235_4437 [Verrucomicrobiae bacterium DG1235]